MTVKQRDRGVMELEGDDGGYAGENCRGENPSSHPERSGTEEEQGVGMPQHLKVRFYRIRVHFYVDLVFDNDYEYRVV